jgi:hypothetical protein
MVIAPIGGLRLFKVRRVRVSPGPGGPWVSTRSIGYGEVIGRFGPFVPTMEAKVREALQASLLRDRMGRHETISLIGIAEDVGLAASPSRHLTTCPLSVVKSAMPALSI